MDRVSRYSYINAKLRARIGLMSASNILESMIKAHSLGEAVAVLSGTQYDSLFRVYQQSADLQQVELELFSREVDIHQQIMKALDGRTAAFVSVLLEKCECENIKNAVRLWYSSNILQHSMSYRANYIWRERIVHAIDWVHIVNSITWEDMAASFAGTPYESVVEKYTLEEMQKGGLFDFEVELDHLWFDRVWTAMEHLDGADRSVAASIYTLDADLKNIINLIRYGFYHAIEPGRLEHVMIRHGELYGVLERKMAKGDFSFTDARDLIKRRYPKVGQLLGEMEVKGELSGDHSELAYGTLAIENFLSRERRRAFTSILSADPFTIGTILSYIYICRSEDNTIKAILSAKYYNWSEEQIRRELN